MMDTEADMVEVLSKCSRAGAGRMRAAVPASGDDEACLCPWDGRTTSAKDEIGLEARSPPGAGRVLGTGGGTWWCWGARLRERGAPAEEEINDLISSAKRAGVSGPLRDFVLDLQAAKRSS